MRNGLFGEGDGCNFDTCTTTTAVTIVVVVVATVAAASTITNQMIEKIWKKMTLLLGWCRRCHWYLIITIAMIAIRSITNAGIPTTTTTTMTTHIRHDTVVG